MRGFLFVAGDKSPIIKEMRLDDISNWITELHEIHRVKLQSELTKWNRMAIEKHIDADMALFIWASEKAEVGQYVNWRLGTLIRLKDTI